MPRSRNLTTAELAEIYKRQGRKDAVQAACSDSGAVVRKSKPQTERRVGKWTIELNGRAPSKKNLLRRSRNGGLFRDAKVAAAIDALTRQAEGQWKGQPLSNPLITMRFFVKDERADLDNQLTCVLDCLVKAGVLTNDNLKHLHGPVTFCGQVDERERVIVDLEVIG